MTRGIPFKSLGTYVQGPYIGDKTVREVIGVPVLPCFNEYCETGTAPHGGLCTECVPLLREALKKLKDAPKNQDAHVSAWEYHHHVSIFGRPKRWMPKQQGGLT